MVVVMMVLNMEEEELRMHRGVGLLRKAFSRNMILGVLFVLTLLLLGGVFCCFSIILEE